MVTLVAPFMSSLCCLECCLPTFSAFVSKTLHNTTLDPSPESVQIFLHTSFFALCQLLPAQQCSPLLKPCFPQSWLCCYLLVPLSSFNPTRWQCSLLFCPGSGQLLPQRLDRLLPIRPFCLSFPLKSNQAFPSSLLLPPANCNLLLSSFSLLGN